MKRSCLLCQALVDITQQDSVFYKEMALPEPKTCPGCRSLLRCVHRNERNLFKRSCDLCKKSIVAMYPSTAPFPVYCPSCFYGDTWNPLKFGRKFNTDRSFMEQLKELHFTVPHLSIMNKQSENSDYCNYSYANKNCYLTAGSHYEEDCLYGAYSTKNRNCLDCLWIYGSELLYECMFTKNSYDSKFLDHCEDSRDCFFSRDLKGCANCLFCANLRQKKFCIFNEQNSEEEYRRILTSLNLQTFSGLEAAKQTYRTELPRRFPVRALVQVQCEDCTGDTLSNCKNMRQCFYASDSEDCAYGLQVDGTYSSMDIDYMGFDRSERCYETIGCLGLFHSIACNACWNGSGLRYCQNCFSCSDCFGCISLQQQKSCILNMQYSKEEYAELSQNIVDHMTTAGEWGAFFPASISPFAYNESMAQDWLPLKKSDALERGYSWREDEQTADTVKVIDAKALPQSIDDIPDDVLNWAIRCAETGRLFRILKKELDFYRQTHTSLPHIHPDERHRHRKTLRNPRKLWQRACGKCEKPISTTYAPGRPETVYCEKCYLQEVY